MNTRFHRRTAITESMSIFLINKVKTEEATKTVQKLPKKQVAQIKKVIAKLIKKQKEEQRENEKKQKDHEAEKRRQLKIAEKAEKLRLAAEKRRRKSQEVDKSTGNVYNRIGTMRNEVSKALAPTSIKLSSELKARRDELLDLDKGKCGYCRVNPANPKKGDHFYPLIINKEPSVYCNDELNLIPCCASCNSSKGGKTYKVWFLDYKKSTKHPFFNYTTEELQQVIDKFDTYDLFMNQHCQKRDSSDLEVFREIIADLEYALSNAQKKLNNHILRKFGLFGANSS